MESIRHLSQSSTQFVSIVYSILAQTLYKPDKSSPLGLLFHSSHDVLSVRFAARKIVLVLCDALGKNDLSGFLVNFPLFVVF
jgi:hypothetical protein